MNYAVMRLKKAITEMGESACEEAIREKKFQKELEVLDEALELCEKAFSKIKVHRDSSNYVEASGHVKGLARAINRLKGRESKTKKGPKRISHEICFPILRAIEFCKKYEIEREWFKNFLKEDGELESQLISKYGLDGVLKLPFISNDERWFYKLEETMERNLFSYGEKHIIKEVNNFEYEESKKLFHETIEPINKKLFNDYKASLKK
jgi:hypothetical protein